MIGAPTLRTTIMESRAISRTSADSMAQIGIRMMSR
jgi:hypothetical protein